MNLDCPSGSGLANGLAAAFHRAPVPSGYTFTTLQPRETLSTRIRISYWCFSSLKTRTNTPLFAYRFMYAYMLIANAFRQPSQLTAMFRTVQDGINYLRIIQRDISSPTSQRGFDLFVLRLCDFHSHCVHEIVLTRPKTNSSPQLLSRSQARARRGPRAFSTTIASRKMIP